MGKIRYIDMKEYGVGTSALIISIFSIMFSFTYLGERSIGEDILHAIGVRFPVNVISVILFVIATFIGQKHIGNYGAKAGRNISIFFIVIMAILTVINLSVT